MNESQPAAHKRSWTSLWRTNPIMMAFATLGLLAVVAATTAVILNTAGLIKFNLLHFLSDSDEAPIRVRNGSLEFKLLDPDQKWEEDDKNAEKTKKKFKVKDKKRRQDTFDVTVAAKAGATCPNALTALQPILRFTYSDGAVIILEAAGKKTWVLPQEREVKGADSPVLEYAEKGEGYLKEIEAGPTLSGLTRICAFANKDQLDSILILNVK